MDRATYSEEGTSLVVIDDKDALAIFTTPKAIDPILAKIRTRIDDFTGDASTEEGRKAIKSMAYAVVRSKTYLDDGIGKKLATEQKEIPKKIDACRKHIRDTLDAWRDEVRKPITEWETREEIRKHNHAENLGEIHWLANGSATMIDGFDAAKMRQHLARLKGMAINEAICEEFLEEYRIAQAAAIEVLTALIVKQEKEEADAHELEQLRAEKAERDRLDRLAQEEEDRLEAARKAEEERQRIATAAAEQARIDAAAEAERLIEAERQRADDAIAAAAAAVAADRQRLEQEAAAKAEEERQRAQNRGHRSIVNLVAVSALMTHANLSDTVAKAVVIAIASGKIPAVTVTY